MARKARESKEAKEKEAKRQQEAQAREARQRQDAAARQKEETARQEALLAEAKAKLQARLAKAEQQAKQKEAERRQLTPEKAKALLRMCENQLKAQLPYPNTYRRASVGEAGFIPVPALATEDSETVFWDFFFEGKKPQTVVGQANGRPLLKGVGQCEINKSTGTIKAGPVF